MSTDDTLARLKALSERLDQLRRQAQEVHNLASDEVRIAHTSSRQREMPKPDGAPEGQESLSAREGASARSSG